MASELPYFKFYPDEWIKGDITVCSMASQGLFINICSYYWAKKGVLTLTQVQQRFNTCSTDVQHLLNNGIFDVDDDVIIIKFLDEQLSQFKELSKKKSRAGLASAKVRRGNTCSTPVQQMIYKEEVEVEGEVEDRLNTLSDPPGSDSKSKKEDSGIFKETEKCLPLSRTLARIVQSQKNIDVTATTKKSWANEIRKLIFTSEKVSYERVETALSWYRKNVGGEYVPVIESGASLRKKFTKLEDAIARDSSGPKNGTVRGGAKTPKDGFTQFESKKIKV